MHRKSVLSISFIFLLLPLGALNAQGKTSRGNFFTEWWTFRTVVHPWLVGVYGGWAHNTLYQGGAENVGRGTTWKAGEGWNAALTGRYQIFNWLAVQADMNFITKNYTKKGAPAVSGWEDLAGVYDDTTNLFLDFPLLVNLSLPFYQNPQKTNTGRFYLCTGFWLGSWLSGRDEGRGLLQQNGVQGITAGDNQLTANYDSEYQFDKHRDNRFDAGYIAGAGLQMDLSGFNVFTEFRYNYSFTDLQKKYANHGFSPKMNDTWTLSAGILLCPGLLLHRGGK
jgi:hypothetical protein